MKPLSRRAFLTWGAAALARPALAQNLVEDGGIERAAPPVRLSEADLLPLLDHPPQSGARATGATAGRVAAKLARHASEFVDGFPWRPFQVTLGISGYETYFNHPDYVYYALALALPYLPKKSADAARKLMTEQLSVRPPYGAEGYDHSAGRPREGYDIPAELRVDGGAQARSAFGVYAFHAWCAAGDMGAPRAHWDAIRSCVRPLLDAPYAFDPARRTYANDEAQKLNGDLAGLLGAIRLARLVKDTPFEKQAVSAAVRLLALRVNLDRINPQVLERTNASTKHLHVVKLARYCDLVPEVGEALRTKTDGLAAARLKAFREARNAWYLAFGERVAGGENYISPPDIAHALFSAAALVENAPAAQLLAWVDVPWCRGDLYFMEKCAQALRSAGRPVGG